MKKNMLPVSSCPHIKGDDGIPLVPQSKSLDKDNNGFKATSSAPVGHRYVNERNKNVVCLEDVS
jgi:hypothetical protein